MTVTITVQMVVAIISLIIGWTGFLLGGIKWLLTRQVTALENRLAEAEKAAASAKDSVGKHKDEVAASISALKLELSQKVVCSNHVRMEGNDQELFNKINSVHYMVGEINGAMDGVKNLTNLMNRFLLEQGDKK